MIEFSCCNKSNYISTWEVVFVRFFNKAANQTPSYINIPQTIARPPPIAPVSHMQKFLVVFNTSGVIRFFLISQNNFKASCHCHPFLHAEVITLYVNNCKASYHHPTFLCADIITLYVITLGVISFLFISPNSCKASCHRPPLSHEEIVALYMIICGVIPFLFISLNNHKGSCHHSSFMQKLQQCM